MHVQPSALAETLGMAMERNMYAQTRINNTYTYALVSV